MTLTVAIVPTSPFGHKRLVTTLDVSALLLEPLLELLEPQLEPQLELGKQFVPVTFGKSALAGNENVLLSVHDGIFWPSLCHQSGHPSLLTMLAAQSL
jgi:hypothetical protein